MGAAALATGSAALAIRAAAPADVPALRAVIHAAFAQYDGQLDPPSGAFAETDASLAAKLGEGGAWVATIDGTPVGCALWLPRADHLLLGRLAVLPAWRGRGVADRLLEAVERTAREHGFDAIQLGVRLVLPRLRAFYAARGFELLEERAHAGYTQPTTAQLVKRLHRAPGPR